MEIRLFLKFDRHWKRKEIPFPLRNHFVIAYSKSNQIESLYIFESRKQYTKDEIINSIFSNTYCHATQSEEYSV